MKKGFTLAEILIVLVIIGILTMILLPMAFQNTPDKEVMKFKKGNSTLSTVIKELVSSDEYYQNGDLGIKANGELIDGSHDGDITYFCNSFADMLSTKSINCSENEICKNQYCWNHLGDMGAGERPLENLKRYADEGCSNSQNVVGAEIISSDDIIFFQVSPVFTFGINHTDAFFANNSSENTELSNEEKEDAINTGSYRKAHQKNLEGFVSTYKYICFDIDEINKGNEPFGYALRYDGKLIPGLRADEWLNKSIQKND